MAKWKVTDEPLFDGAIRVVNYVIGTQRSKDIYGNKGPETPIIDWRIEQLGPWGWQKVPVYNEEADGTLTEVGLD
jgi:hypothetical protein